MSDYNTLFKYLYRLKARVKWAVIVQNSQVLKTAMTCNKNADNAVWPSRVIGDQWRKWTKETTTLR